MILDRKDYKQIKHMNRDEMLRYLQRVYMKGYEAGVQATKQTEMTKGDGNVKNN